MITVRVTPCLIDEIFREGYTTRGILRVPNGIPKGAYFVGVRYDCKRGYVTLEFLDPEPGPDRELTPFVCIDHVEIKET